MAPIFMNRDTRRRPVAVIGWADDSAMTVSGHGWTAFNSRDSRIFQVFETEHSSMRWLGKSRPDTIKQIKDAN
jgi:hypothetical protein